MYPYKENNSFNISLFNAVASLSVADFKNILSTSISFYTIVSRIIFTDSINPS
jgi:hypothetical protein